MTDAEAIKGAKLRANLPLEVTEFDAELGLFATDAVKRLFPIVQRQMPADTSVTLAKDTHTFTLPTGLESIRSGGLFIKSTTLTKWESFDEFTQHDRLIYLEGDFTVAKDIKILGLGRYTLKNLPEEYDVAVIYYVLAEFFALLAGNKSKYNTYIQASGARGVDNMRDMADWYTEKANQEVADRAQIEGA